jgi:hypothetical protein
MVVMVVTPPLFPLVGGVGGDENYGGGHPLRNRCSWPHPGLLLHCVQRLQDFVQRLRETAALLAFAHLLAPGVEPANRQPLLPQ